MARVEYGQGIYGVPYKDNKNGYAMLQNRAQRARDPVRYLYNQAKYRAKQRGHEFTIERTDLVVPETCPVYGIPLFFTPGGRTDNSFSIDRKDNTKGYVPGNVCVISFKANQMKGDMSIDEVKALLRYMES